MRVGHHPYCIESDSKSIKVRRMLPYRDGICSKYSDSDVLFSATHLDAIARAELGIMVHLEITAKRVQDARSEETLYD
jgi:hypothetical protein